jgi:lanosterol synthase
MGRDLYGKSINFRTADAQSCVTMEYCQHERSQVVMTSWALLALIYAGCPHRSVIERAVALIMSRQKPDGRWEQEDTEGIFNKTCAIDYPGELTRCLEKAT